MGGGCVPSHRTPADYCRLGLFLQKYKSGPLPKIFKVIPALPAWARLLALTHPEDWSPHACRAATRIFISSMKPPQAQLFLGVVLLDAIREDIRANKKLNVHYYEALKRSLFKPSAFFKGIIFPLLDVGRSSVTSASPEISLLARLYLKGGRYYRLHPGSYESSGASCIRRLDAYRGDGLLWFANTHLMRTRDNLARLQAPIRYSSVS